VVGGAGGMAAAGHLLSRLRGAHVPAQHRAIQPTDSALELLWGVRRRNPHRLAGDRDADWAR